MPSRATLRLLLGEPDRCAICGDPLTGEEAQPDHILPKSRGGSDAAPNRAWVHPVCNRLKGDLTMDELWKLAWKIVRHLGKTA